VSPIDAKAATDNRDSLAKTIYSRLFDWLVAKINTSIGQDPNAVSMVGVLDIYGEHPNNIPQECPSKVNVCASHLAIQGNRSSWRKWNGTRAGRLILVCDLIRLRVLQGE
jgi:hypothetical protein